VTYLALLVLVLGGVRWLAYLVKRRRRDQAADYVQRIQVLKSDSPLALPAIKPLQGRIQ